MVRDRKTGTWHCYMCFVMPEKFPQPTKARPVRDDGPALLAGDDPIDACLGDDLQRGDRRNASRDGLFDIAEGKRRDPTFTARRRVGPHR